MARRVAVLLAGLALVAGACSSSGGSTPAPAGSSGGGSLSGKVVTVYGAFGAPESDQFNATIKPFEDATGIIVKYDGDKNFEQDLNVRISAGNPPDIAMLPQPGSMRQYAAQGKLFPLPADIVASIDQNYGPGWKEIGTAADGKVYGVFHRVNIKGMVFYPKVAFDAKGYKVPTTWDQLTALETQMAADGTPPWCIGLESGAASGWPATDWVEQLMLRTVGVTGYDKWTLHQIPFTDPSVKNAVQIVYNIWTHPGWVYGGASYMVATNFGDAPPNMFTNPPKCWLTDQGDFITSFFPAAAQKDLDTQVGVFPLPPYTAAGGAPIEVGGDQMVAFANRPEIWAFLKFITTPQAGVSWEKAGGALFPYKNQDISNYPTKIYQQFAQTLASATGVRFDASDQMPAQVGSAGAFSKEMVNLFNGQENIDTALKNIEAAWPSP